MFVEINPVKLLDTHLSAGSARQPVAPAVTFKQGANVEDTLNSCGGLSPYFMVYKVLKKHCRSFYPPDSPLKVV